LVEEQIPRPVRSQSARGFGVLVCLLAGLVLAAAPAEGAYPGRNGKIAYTDWDGANSNGSLSWVASIWSNGKGARTHAVGVSDPAYSPSGRTLAYADDYDSGIWITRPEGRRVRRITRGLDFSPDFAPSGRRIVFVRLKDSGAEGEIRIYHAGRTALLTHGDAPAWSARGRAIAFTRTLTDGTPRSGIYTIGPDGRNLRFVTLGSSPDWSPSGRTLGFVTPAGRLATIRPSGAGFRRLTQRTGYTKPAFSPDGRSLAAARSESGQEDLVTINLRTRRLRSVFFPEAGIIGNRIDWQPLPRRR
jgi:Tol biopolymer transport system component